MDQDSGWVEILELETNAEVARAHLMIGRVLADGTEWEGELLSVQAVRSDTIPSADANFPPSSVSCTHPTDTVTGRIPSSTALAFPRDIDTNDRPAHKHRQNNHANDGALVEHLRNGRFVAPAHAREDDDVHRGDGPHDGPGESSEDAVDQPVPGVRCHRVVSKIPVASSSR